MRVCRSDIVSHTHWPALMAEMDWTIQGTLYVTTWRGNVYYAQDPVRVGCGNYNASSQTP